MDLTTIATFFENNLDLVISIVISLGFFVVNIIQAIRTKDKSKLIEALDSVPQVIRQVEQISSIKKLSALEKKAAAESILYNHFGKKFVDKHITEFDIAIEDVLDTPAKKGGSYVSQENEEIKG